MTDIWEEEETWKTLRKSYGLMQNLKGGFRTQFIQAAYSECYVAWKLFKAGYKIEFHNKNDKCDLSVILRDSKRIKLDIKHSEDNKHSDKMGRGFASWVITTDQIKKKKFNLCILIRDNVENLLQQDEPGAIYVFKREEIAATKPVDVNPPKLDYYLWFSKYFEDIVKRRKWMRKATNELVESLSKNPERFEDRWNRILRGELLSMLNDKNMTL